MTTTVSALGTIWNLPNYTGELFTADAETTPLLAMLGGLTNGGLQTDNFEFPTASPYGYPEAAQPEYTENQSLAAPTAISYVRAQEKNVTQIFHEQIALSYVKMANQGRLSGINTAGANNNAASELDWQIARALVKIARDVEYTFLNGAYQLAGTAEQANKTRGMFALVNGSDNEIDADAAALSKALIDELLREMASNGASFNNMVMFSNAYLKQMISDIYGYVPESRNVGGLNIEQIITDFASIGVVWNRFMPTDKILLVDMSVLAPVFQPVPGKGNLFYEQLSKTGAAEKGQLFGQVGLAHGPAFMHGAIVNLNDGS